MFHILLLYESHHSLAENEDKHKWTWHWLVETVWDHAVASLSLKPVQIITRSDTLAHRKKQMGMFQFNAIPGA